MFYSILFLICCCMQSLESYSPELFYKNSVPTDEPRFDRDFLNSIDLSVCCGSAHKGKNGARETTALLDIYGVQDFYYTFLNYNANPAAPASLSHDQKTTINNFLTLAAADTTKTIGKVSFEGRFRYCTTEIKITQNFIGGFFLEFILPFSRVSVHDIKRTHQSSTTHTSWTNFNNQLEALLAAYNVSIDEYHNSTISDVTLLGGWTSNTETSDVFDFIDTSLRLGVSIPTSKPQSTTSAFSLPAGYNGHVGIPAIASLAWGLYDWLTLGCHVKGHYFLKTNDLYRMRTDSHETGHITLRRGPAHKQLGNLWSIGTYLKADHIVRGFSLQFNYNYCIQEHAYLEPFDTQYFSSTTVNAAENLKKWSLHEIYCAAEYDFAQEGQQWNPHIKVFYAQTVQGCRSYLTKSGGFSTGLYIIVNF